MGEIRSYAYRLCEWKKTEDKLSSNLPTVSVNLKCKCILEMVDCTNLIKIKFNKLESNKATYQVVGRFALNKIFAKHYVVVKEPPGLALC